jgi:hypothetical protein
MRLPPNSTAHPELDSSARNFMIYQRPPTGALQDVCVMSYIMKECRSQFISGQMLWTTSPIRSATFFHIIRKVLSSLRQLLTEPQTQLHLITQLRLVLMAAHFKFHILIWLRASAVCIPLWRLSFDDIDLITQATWKAD